MPTTTNIITIHIIIYYFDLFFGLMEIPQWAFSAEPVITHNNQKREILHLCLKNSKKKVSVEESF